MTWTSLEFKFGEPSNQMQTCIPMCRFPSSEARGVLTALPRALGRAPLPPLPPSHTGPSAWDSLDLEGALQQAAPLRYQLAVLHQLIQRVGEENLHSHRLLHAGLVQHLWGEGLTESGLGCSFHLPLMRADGAAPEAW